MQGVPQQLCHRQRQAIIFHTTPYPAIHFSQQFAAWFLFQGSVGLLCFCKAFSAEQRQLWEQHLLALGYMADAQHQTHSCSTGNRTCWEARRCTTILPSAWQHRARLELWKTPANYPLNWECETLPVKVELCKTGYGTADWHLRNLLLMLFKNYRRTQIPRE